MNRSSKSNAKFLEIPHTFAQVVVQEPRAKRKEFPFQGFIDFQGLEIDVENVKGSTRSGTGPEGDWSIYMHTHYGEIRKTEGTDGDKLDVYVGDNHDSSLVVVIHQHNPWDGQYDEDKVILGCESVEEAIGLYKKQYDRPGFYKPGEHTAMPIGAFWRWVHEEKNRGKKVKISMASSREVRKPQNPMWKKSYAEGSPGELNAAKTLIRNLLALLRAVQWNHLTSHWQSQGVSSYGDHLLFQRLYEAMGDEIDALAEKSVGLFGSNAVDSADQALRMSAQMRVLSAVRDPYERGLKAEKALQDLLARVRKELQKMGQLPLGLDDYLAATASTHDTHVFLLQQRRESSSTPSALRTVAARYALFRGVR